VTVASIAGVENGTSSIFKITPAMFEKTHESKKFNKDIKDEF
jgi:hypothetical protein